MYFVPVGMTTAITPLFSVQGWREAREALILIMMWGMWSLHLKERTFSLTAADLFTALLFGETGESISAPHWPITLFLSITMKWVRFQVWIE